MGCQVLRPGRKSLGTTFRAFRRPRRGCFSDVEGKRRRADPGGGERFVRLARQVRPEPVAFAVEIDDHGLDSGEIAHQVGPGRLDLVLVEPDLEIDLEPQREETADDVADRVLVEVVEDRPDLERGLSSRKVRSTRQRLL